jgi:hypothetical protein
MRPGLAQRGAAAQHTQRGCVARADGAALSRRASAAHQVQHAQLRQRAQAGDHLQRVAAEVELLEGARHRREAVQRVQRPAVQHQAAQAAELRQARHLRHALKAVPHRGQLAHLARGHRRVCAQLNLRQRAGVAHGARRGASARRGRRHAHAAAVPRARRTRGVRDECTGRILN